MPSTLSITEDGDQELWVVYGQLEDGFRWQLPLKANPWKSEGERIYFIKDEFWISQSQYTLLSALLTAWDIAQDEKGWWLKESQLCKIASKAPGITPEYYIRWPGYKYVPVESEITLQPDPDLSPQTVKFLKYVQYMVGEPSLEIYKIIWKAVNKFGARWVAIDQKVLDLGLVKLVPIPYRVNWKDILCTLYRDILFYFKRKDQQRDEALFKSGFIGTLAAVEMLAVHPLKHFIKWTVESLPSQDLDRMMDEHEYEKFQRMGRVAYARRILGCMSRSFSEAMAIIARYISKMAYPRGRIGRSNGGATIILPEASTLQLRPKTDFGDMVDVVVPDPFSALQQESRPPDVEPEVSYVPALPDFLKRIKDMRPMEGSDQRQRNDSRVRVRDVGKGKLQEQHLLGEGQQSGNGLASITPNETTGNH